MELKMVINMKPKTRSGVRILTDVTFQRARERQRHARIGGPDFMAYCVHET